MKNTFSALCALAFAGSSFGQNSNFDPLGENLNLPKQIRVIVEYIEVPLPELTKLLAEPRKSANDGDLRKTVGKLVEAGTAIHQETQFVISRSGETATTEGILEYTYPTEYEPAEIPNEVTSNDDTAKSAELAKSIATQPTPTAFETRNLGSTLEIQPTIGANDSVIDLRFAPELVEHVKNEVWAEWNGTHGKADVIMPLFFSNRINTGVTLINGQYCLAGTTSMKGEDGKPDHQRKLLFFVRADILTVGL